LIVLACFVAAIGLIVGKRAAEQRQVVPFSAAAAGQADTPVINGQPVDTGPQETFPAADPEAKNFLVVGADNNACIDPKSKYAPGLAKDGHNGLTDTIMVIRVDAGNKRAAVLSFPRDLWVDLPGTGKRRINAAYRKDDPTVLQTVLHDEFGVTVDHFVQVDFCAFQVPMPYPMRDVNTGLGVYVKDCHRFAGDEALAYVRSRHIEYTTNDGATWKKDQSADIGRIARQQDFIRRTLKAIGDGGLFSPKKIKGLYDAYKKDLVTDKQLTPGKIFEFAGVIRDLDPQEIRSYQIEATPTNISGNSVLVWDKESATMQAILDIFRGRAPLAGTSAQPGETPSSAVPSAAPSAAPAPQEPTTTASVTPAVDTAPESFSPKTAIVPDPTVECSG
jgi:LCP family protein required for cell wall assembly